MRRLLSLFIICCLAISCLAQTQQGMAYRYRKYKDELKDDLLDDFKQYAEAGVIPPEYEADVEKIKRLLEEK